MNPIKKIITDLRKMRRTCKTAGSGFFATLLKSLVYRILYNKKIVAHRKVIIKGVKNIKSNTVLTIGLGNAGFVHDYDITYLKIDGSLSFKGNYNIGRGCRIDIAEGAEVTFGEGGYTNVNNTFIIKNRLVVGNGCIISWNCQFLDDDFHELEYEGRINKKNEIVLGDHVWVGCGVELYKGAVIPDGCVIAAGSVIRSSIGEENCLVAGNPAKIIKRNVSWR